MASTGRTWEWTNHSAWATVLGLVPVPLFGGTRRSEWPGTSTVLLDGQRSSFVLYSTSDYKLDLEARSVSWSWTANLRHALILDESRDEMVLRRWDTAEYRRFRMPAQPAGARQLLELIENAPSPRGPDVILHALRGFRRLRASLPSRDALDSVRIFNALLVGTEAVRRGTIDERQWLECRTVADVVEQTPEGLLDYTEVHEISHAARSADIGAALTCFIEPEPTSNWLLDPDLLLRHAAGQLYQEAHLILEKEAQLYLPGLASDEMPRGTLRRDVRFTPTTLARALAQRALDGLISVPTGPNALDILDPACGSGVFLQELLRELQTRGYQGRVRLRGFDISEVSCSMSRFCLNRLALDASEAGIECEVSILNRDALKEGWGQPDLILMNPPFVPWHGMNGEDQEIVKSVLYGVPVGRADKAMAFLFKGEESLRQGAVMASVLPAALLATKSGEAWRERLTRRAEITLVGRFEGFGFFRGSLVEPGFVILKVPPDKQTMRDPITVVIASEGAEDAAIRGLRQPTEPADSAPERRWEVFEVAPGTISPANWSPRPRRHLELIEQMAATGMTKVGQLFAVHQGTRTGCNPVFLLSEHEMNALPKEEHAYFRPAATNATIGAGVVVPGTYVFYPYDQDGLTLGTEVDLQTKVPSYYEARLRLARRDLVARCRSGEGNWWTLAEARHWQWTAHPKLVSKYFGERGSFAYDESGEYVVVQGFGWLWKANLYGMTFLESDLPYAYLALLNSSVFEDLLACFCPRIQGGQFDLSPRFLNVVFLPDLSEESCVPGDVVQDLASLGKQIHAGDAPPAEQLTRLAERVYGLSAVVGKRT